MSLVANDRSIKMHSNYNVSWWMYSYKNGGYDNHDESVIAENEFEAISKMKKKYRRGKDFKAWK